MMNAMTLTPLNLNFRFYLDKTEESDKMSLHLQEDYMKIISNPFIKLIIGLWVLLNFSEQGITFYVSRLDGTDEDIEPH